MKILVWANSFRADLFYGHCICLMTVECKQVTGLFYPPTELTFRHRASCILGQVFRYSPENAFYIFNQQIYFII